jgi:5-methylthioadenosine/S-adenosylhomocysteine deaminase
MLNREAVGVIVRRVPDVERLGETGLMHPGHTYNHCSGFSDEMCKAIADSGAAVNLVPRSTSSRGRTRSTDSAASLRCCRRTDTESRSASAPTTSSATDTTCSPRCARSSRCNGGLSFAAEYAGDADVPRRYGVEDVLRAATVGSAINAGRQDEVGTIEVGKRADLVLIALDEVTTRLCGSDVAAVNNGGAAGVDRCSSTAG